MSFMHAKFHIKTGQFDVFLPIYKLLLFFTDQNYPLVINCAIFLHCLKTRFLDFIRWSILRGFKFLGYQSRWRRMDPNFQCMSIWPEKKIGNKMKIDGRNQGFIMRKSNSTLTFLAVSAFLISPRLCSLWETQTAFSLANYLKDSLMSFLPACILHSST